jgi:hypothetical protein
MLGNEKHFHAKPTEERKKDLNKKVNDKQTHNTQRFYPGNPNWENQHSLSIFLSCCLIHSE